MLRSKTYWVVLALIAAGASTACTRTDIAGPSADQPRPSFEGQGGNH
jgi:hypothetical protein